MFVQIINNIVNLIGDESVGLTTEVKNYFNNHPTIKIFDLYDFNIIPKIGDYYADGEFYTQEEWYNKQFPSNPSHNIDYLRELKLQEISHQCEKIIFSGVDVETSQGLKHFSLTILDQINLTSMLNEVKNTNNNFDTNLNLKDGVPYHADGELCRLWSLEDFYKISKTAMDFVFYNQTYCNHLLEYIKIADLDQINDIYYGMNLPLAIQIKFMDILNAVSKNE